MRNLKENKSNVNQFKKLVINEGNPNLIPHNEALEQLLIDLFS